jgi:predicted glycosyltransferase involved in capsule biosynthesis
MQRQTYIDIGGYDEDFTGQAFDDDDFVTRLQDHGCKYRRTKARCVHLYHTRSGPGRSRKLHEYNRKLFNARRGIIVRNVGREWGVLKGLSNVPTT